MRPSLLLSIFIMIGAFYSHAIAQEGFTDGPVIYGYGKVAKVDTDRPLPVDLILKHSFDVGDQAKQGTQNRYINSAARFMNLHAAAGMKPEDIQIAVVIHGGASKDLLKNEVYQALYEMENANAGLIQSLLDNNIQIILCGQTAAYHKINKSDLIEGVQLSHSAMTTHAVLQQEGYTINPF